MDTAPNTNTVANVEERVRLIDYSLVGMLMLLVAWLIATLVGAAKIITPFEMVEALLIWMSLIYTLIGLGLVYLGALGLTFMSQQSQLAPLPEILDILFKVSRGGVAEMACAR